MTHNSGTTRRIDDPCQRLFVQARGSSLDELRRSAEAARSLGPEVVGKCVADLNGLRLARGVSGRGLQSWSRPITTRPSCCWPRPLVASARSADHVAAVASSGAHDMTLSPEIATAVLNDPLLAAAAEKFEAAVRSNRVPHSPTKLDQEGQIR